MEASQYDSNLTFGIMFDIWSIGLRKNSLRLGVGLALSETVKRRRRTAQLVGRLVTKQRMRPSNKKRLIPISNFCILHDTVIWKQNIGSRIPIPAVD